jgi:hypothetical protein
MPSRRKRRGPAPRGAGVRAYSSNSDSNTPSSGSDTDAAVSHAGWPAGAGAAHHSAQFTGPGAARPTDDDSGDTGAGTTLSQFSDLIQELFVDQYRWGFKTFALGFGFIIGLTQLVSFIIIAKDIAKEGDTPVVEGSKIGGTFLPQFNFSWMLAYYLANDLRFHLFPSKVKRMLTKGEKTAKQRMVEVATSFGWAFPATMAYMGLTNFLEWITLVAPSRTIENVISLLFLARATSGFFFSDDRTEEEKSWAAIRSQTLTEFYYRLECANRNLFQIGGEDIFTPGQLSTLTGEQRQVLEPYLEASRRQAAVKKALETRLDRLVKTIIKDIKTTSAFGDAVDADTEAALPAQVNRYDGKLDDIENDIRAEFGPDFFNAVYPDDDSDDAERSAKTPGNFLGEQIATAKANLPGMVQAAQSIIRDPKGGEKLAKTDLTSKLRENFDTEKMFDVTPERTGSALRAIVANGDQYLPFHRGSVVSWWKERILHNVISGALLGGVGVTGYFLETLKGISGLAKKIAGLEGNKDYKLSNGWKWAAGSFAFFPFGLLIFGVASDYVALELSAWIIGAVAQAFYRQLPDLPLSYKSGPIAALHTITTLPALYFAGFSWTTTNQLNYDNIDQSAQDFLGGDWLLRLANGCSEVGAPLLHIWVSFTLGALLTEVLTRLKAKDRVLSNMASLKGVLRDLNLIVWRNTSSMQNTHNLIVDLLENLLQEKQGTVASRDLEDDGVGSKATLSSSDSSDSDDAAAAAVVLGPKHRATPGLKDNAHLDAQKAFIQHFSENDYAWNVRNAIITLFKHGALDKHMTQSGLSSVYAAATDEKFIKKPSDEEKKSLMRGLNSGKLLDPLLKPDSYDSGKTTEANFFIALDRELKVGFYHYLQQKGLLPADSVDDLPDAATKAKAIDAMPPLQFYRSVVKIEDQIKADKLQRVHESAFERIGERMKSGARCCAGLFSACTRQSAAREMGERAPLVAARSPV